MSSTETRDGAMTAPSTVSDAEALVYGQKLIAEAILSHFGERTEFDDEDGDTTNQDVWGAYDALLAASAVRKDALREAATRLVDAKALAGVRGLVAGWNGEGKPNGPYERHPPRLGATLPKTNCGDVYELDEAMQALRAALEPKP